MGYCMYQLGCSDFFISRQNVSRALNAIKKLAGNETIEDSSGRHYSWVSGAYAEAESLEEAMEDWRWYPEMDDTGNVIRLEFNGEKLGDDHILLSAIAPFVDRGEIEMEGEDGARWLWRFKNGQCVEVTARIVYDE